MTKREGHVHSSHPGLPLPFQSAVGLLFGAHYVMQQQVAAWYPGNGRQGLRNSVRSQEQVSGHIFKNITLIMAERFNCL